MRGATEENAAEDGTATLPTAAWRASVQSAGWISLRAADWILPSGAISARRRRRGSGPRRRGDVAIGAVGRTEIEELVDGLDEKVTAGTLSWKTAANVWGLVTKLFADAQSGKPRRFQVRRDNPTTGVRGPDRGARVAKQFLYPNECVKLFACERIPLHWRIFYAVSLYTYTRAGELRPLTWDDVDLEHGIIHITKAVDRVTHEVKPTKGRATRRLPIEPALRPLLERLAARPHGGQDAVVWCPPDVKRATTFRDHLKLAGVKRRELHVSEPGRSMHITAHDLRSTGMTHAILRGDEWGKVRQRAGHSGLER